MDRLTQILHDANVRYQHQQGVVEWHKPRGDKFEEPTSEQWIEHHRRYHPAGYYRLFCAHDKPLWQPCSSQTCRRTAKEAKINFAKLCNGTLK